MSVEEPEARSSFSSPDASAAEREDHPVIVPVCVLDYGLFVGEALRRLDTHAGVERVALRWQVRAEVTWHILPVAALFAILAGKPRRRRLAQVECLNPRFWPPVHTLDLAQGPRRRVTSFEGLVLDGGSVLGWISLPERGREHSDDHDLLNGVGWVRTHGRPRDALLSPEILWNAKTSGGLQAFPAIRAPAVVESGEAFTAMVHLHHTPPPDNFGQLLISRIPQGHREITLDLQFTGDGFAAVSGWRHQMRVLLNDVRSSAVELRLIAPRLKRSEPVRLGFLLVHFSYNGVPCGMASRAITTHRPGALTGEECGALAEQEYDGQPPFPLQIDVPAPDLTVRLSKPDGNFAAGRFVMTFDPSPLVHDLPDHPLPVNLGDDAETFAKSVRRIIEENDGRPLGSNSVAAAGSVIGEKLPDEFWQVLRDAGREARKDRGRVPTLLLLSAEPHVPWELARMEEPLDPDLPRYLGAQVAMARWILNPGGRPAVPPHQEITVRHMVAVTGEYKALKLKLPSAIKEGQALEKRFGAVRVPLRESVMAQLLDGRIEADGKQVAPEAIHFACHGRSDPADPQWDLLLYEDGRRGLNAMHFRSAAVGRTGRPFLFLNACQAGGTGQTLDTYAGFAGYSLSAGFRGFIGPFWSVRDDVAADIAIEFYERAFAEHPRHTVAEILRSIRARYAVDGEDTATLLAYTFYGHPHLLLTRAQAG